MTRLMRDACRVVLAVLSFACGAMGQAETATVSGLITDDTGAVVPGAEVKLQSVERGTVGNSKTNNAGIYVFASVHPGQYQLTVQKPGFKQVDFLGLIVNVQDHIEQNFRLQVGSVSESLTVTANGLNVNTTDAAVSTVIDRNFVESLPLNGRSFNTLLQLTPGVVIAPSAAGPLGQGYFSVAGQRTSSNNFLVDGVSANFGVAPTAAVGTSGTGSAQAFSQQGGTSSLVSVEALQEFRIETSSFAPEFGRAPGGQVLLTTRSGTNGFHGGIYEYFRNNVLDANDWFANQSGQPRAPERHNDFGGYLGGPIQRDKTFFFISDEGARLRQPQTQQSTVPYITPSVPSCSAPAAIAPFLNAYPKPNGPVSATTCTGQFTGSYSAPSTLNAGSIRIDHTFSSAFSIFGRYNEAPSEGAVRTNSLSELLMTTVGTRTLTLGATMVLNPQLTNMVRGNYSVQNSSLIASLDSFGGAVPPSLSLLGPNLPNAKNSIFTFGTFDTSTYVVGPSSRNRSTQLNFADDLAFSHGVHQIKIGADYRAIYLDVRPFEAFVGYSAISVTSFLSTGQADAGISGGRVKSSYLRAQATSIYGQDTWKVTPRLAITYGLRWELSPAPSPRSGTTLAAWENVNTPAQLALAPTGTPVWNTTYANFAPRVGMAYSLTSRGDFVLRAGWGMFYDLASDAIGNLAGSFPNAASGSFPPASLPVSDATQFVPALSRQPPFPNGTTGYSPNLKLPRSYQWNVALEKSFGGKQAVSMTYVGQAGRDLLRQEGINQPNANFLGPFGLTQTNAYSNYAAVQVQYRRPFSSGFQALLNYTWSHSLDNASNDVLAAVSNIVISAANDYASSDHDVRHSFSGGLVYAVPAAAKNGPLGRLTRDWSIDAVIVARSGFPFNVSAPVSFQSGSASPRPDLIPGQPFWIRDSTAGGGKSLNPGAFVASVGQQGTEGRNDIPGFGLTQVDLSLGRKFVITERLNLQFRTDAFNLFNHPNFINPQAVLVFGSIFGLKSPSMLNQGLGGLGALFQQGGPRSMQLSLKLTF